MGSCKWRIAGVESLTGLGAGATLHWLRIWVSYLRETNIWWGKGSEYSIPLFD